MRKMLLVAGALVLTSNFAFAKPSDIVMNVMGQVVGVVQTSNDPVIFQVKITNDSVVTECVTTVPFSSKMILYTKVWATGSFEYATTEKINGRKITVDHLNDCGIRPQ